MMRKLFAWWRRRQGDRLRIPDSLWDQVEAGLPFLGHLTPDEHARLRLLARQFIAEKQWSGAQGPGSRACAPAGGGDVDVVTPALPNRSTALARAVESPQKLLAAPLLVHLRPPPAV